MIMIDASLIHKRSHIRWFYQTRNQFHLSQATQRHISLLYLSMKSFYAIPIFRTTWQIQSIQWITFSFSRFSPGHDFSAHCGREPKNDYLIDRERFKISTASYFGRTFPQSSAVLFRLLSLGNCFDIRVIISECHCLILIGQNPMTVSPQLIGWT